MPCVLVLMRACVRAYGGRAKHQDGLAVSGRRWGHCCLHRPPLRPHCCRGRCREPPCCSAGGGAGHPSVRATRRGWQRRLPSPRCVLLLLNERICALYSLLGSPARHFALLQLIQMPYQYQHVQVKIIFLRTGAESMKDQLENRSTQNPHASPLMLQCNRLTPCGAAGSQVERVATDFGAVRSTRREPHTRSFGIPQTK
jgi:hypothetical protein